MSNKARRLSFLLSILFHLLLILPFIPSIEEEDRTNNSTPREKRIVLIEMFSDENKKFRETTKKGDLKLNKKTSEDKDKKQTQKGSDTNCESFYFGVGIEVVFRYIEDKLVKEIVRVYEGYPAHKHGLQLGDIIWEEDPSLKGDRVDRVRIKIQRGSEFFDLYLFRDKICTE